MQDNGESAPSWLFSFLDLALLMLVAMTQLAPDTPPEIPNLGQMVVPRIGEAGSDELAAACLDQRCFADVDCVRPRVCGPGGHCRLECTTERPCRSGLSCVGHRCRADGGLISCPAEMAAVAGAFCVDRYEASRPDATASAAGSDDSRALSVAGVLPWQVASNELAESACAAAGKRLCTADEWGRACAGSGLSAGPGDAPSERQHARRHGGPEAGGGAGDEDARSIRQGHSPPAARAARVARASTRVGGDLD